MGFRFIMHPESDRPFSVEQGDLAISNEPMETSGLVTCSAIIVSDGKQNLLGHIDAADNPAELASFIRENFEIDNDNFVLSIADGGPIASVARQIILDAADILGVKTKIISSQIEPMGTVEVSGDGEVQIKTTADNLKDMQADNQIQRDGHTYVWVTNATNDIVEQTPDGVTVTPPLAPGNPIRYPNAIVGEDSFNNPDDNLVGVYIPKPPGF